MIFLKFLSFKTSEPDHAWICRVKTRFKEISEKYILYLIIIKLLEKFELIKFNEF
jgi:hypothetical protein